LEFLSLHKLSFGSLFGSLIGTVLIIAKIYAFANAERELFAERLQLINKKCFVCNKKSFDNKLKM
jgi:hypothetical protein